MDHRTIGGHTARHRVTQLRVTLAGTAVIAACTALAGCEVTFRVKGDPLNPQVAAKAGGLIGSVVGGPIGEAIGSDLGYAAAVAAGLYATKKHGDAKVARAARSAAPQASQA